MLHQTEKTLQVQTTTKILGARCGVRTHALLRVSELKSDALDRSANLAHVIVWQR